MLSDAGQCSLRAAAACYMLNVTGGHCLAALKSLLMCTSVATVAVFTLSSCFIRFGHFISSSVVQLWYLSYRDVSVTVMALF